MIKDDKMIEFTEMNKLIKNEDNNQRTEMRILEFIENIKGIKCLKK